MKMTNNTADERLQHLMELQSSKEQLPVVAGYRILQNIHALKTALQPFHDTVDEVIRRYSGGKETIHEADDPEGFSRAAEEIRSLRDIEIDVDISPISIQSIQDRDLPMNVLFALDFMLGEE